MDDVIREAKARIKEKRANLIDKEKHYFKSPSKKINLLFSKTLISIILVLSVAIYVSISDNNLLNFKTKVFQDTLLFTKINNLYAKYFGDVIPSKVNKNTTTVFGNTLKYTNIEQFDKAYKLTLESNVVNTLESGIVVFMGEKDNLGKTIIIQGIDGVDIWYSNISYNDLTLYDYIEKNSIIGEANNQELYLTFLENGETVGYEKYLN